MEIITSFFITFLAGISTLIGYLFTYIKSKNIDRLICIFLSFAFGVMILISIKELTITPIKYIIITNNIYNSLLIIIFIPIIIYLIIKLLNKNTKSTNSLYRVGVLSAISLILHNIPEGIITFMTSSININLGIKLARAIRAHNVPEGILIAIPIYYATNSRGKALLFTLVAGLSEIIGGTLFYILFNQFINIYILNIILYIIGCLMIMISLIEILPEILKYKNKYWIMIGVLFSLFILVL